MTSEDDHLLQLRIVDWNWGGLRREKRSARKSQREERENIGTHG